MSARQVPSVWQHFCVVFCDGCATSVGTDGHVRAGTSAGDAEVELDQGTDSLERIAQSTRTWIIGQLGIIVKSPACSESVAVTILEFLATVAFAEAGAKAKKSKVAHVKGLGGCTIPLSDEVRGLAAARTAAIATDALPCTREKDQREQAADAAAPEENVMPAQATGKQTSKKHKALTCLLHKVREHAVPR